MIIIKEKSSKIVEIQISGSFSRSDVKQLASKLKKYARDSINVRLLLIVKNFQGWYGAGPWWSDLKLDEECDCNVGFERIALIGDHIWKVWMTTLVSSFNSSKIKFFNENEISTGRKWLRNKDKSRNDFVKLTTEYK